MRCCWWVDLGCKGVVGAGGGAGGGGGWVGMGVVGHRVRWQVEHQLNVVVAVSPNCQFMSIDCMFVLMIAASMDPYVILTCRTQEQKSSISTEWNETFVFRVSGDVPDLNLKIMDKDNFSADDFVGEANLPIASYNVVKDGEFKGEIRVGLTFTPESYHGRDLPEEELGGWKQSSYGY
ncbi:Elicitor-responsive protein 3 [Bienertia sinuspersici]